MLNNSRIEIQFKICNYGTYFFTKIIRYTTRKSEYLFCFNNHCKHYLLLIFYELQLEYEK